MYTRAKHGYIYARTPDGPWSSAGTVLAAISYMMTPSDGNIFRVTGHLCREFTGDVSVMTQVFSIAFCLKMCQTHETLCNLMRLNKFQRVWHSFCKLITSHEYGSAYQRFGMVTKNKVSAENSSTWFQLQHYMHKCAQNIWALWLSSTHLPGP